MRVVTTTAECLSESSTKVSGVACDVHPQLLHARPVFFPAAAPLLSPYDPTMAGRNKDYLNGAPNVPMFCDKNGCSVRPFLHTIERERSIKTNFRWVEKINDDRRRYVQFFVTGSEFRLLGLVPMKTHLFGIDEGRIHLFGTDASGKDIFSRTLHAIWTSLQVGTIGVLISFVLARSVAGGRGECSRCGWVVLRDGATE